MTMRLPEWRLHRSEAPEATRDRLGAAAGAALETLMAERNPEAVAYDGSLATGRLWPSSDIDVTLVPRDADHQGVEWHLWDGTIVHIHVNPRGLLERLQQGFPDSFVQTAAGDWIRDPTWMLDGLATMSPVLDNDGFLAHVREFVRQNRFDPDVVEERRPLLLARGCDLRKKARQSFEAGDMLTGAWRLELAAEAHALAWLEASRRMISLKEMDWELNAACRECQAPGAHRLFRAVAGVDDFEDKRPSVLAALEHLTDLYSEWLGPIVERYPSGNDEMNRLPRLLIHHRHRLWSAIHALERDCLLHAAAVRFSVSQSGSERLQQITRQWAAATGAPLAEPEAEIEVARNDLLAAFDPPPWQDRLRALHDLEVMTLDRFEAEAEQ